MPAPSRVPGLLEHDSPRLAHHASGAAAATSTHAAAPATAPAAAAAATAFYHAVPAPSHALMESEGPQWRLEDWVCPDLQRLLQVLTGRASQAPQAELRRLRRWVCDGARPYLTNGPASTRDKPLPWPGPCP